MSHSGKTKWTAALAQKPRIASRRTANLERVGILVLDVTVLDRTLQRRERAEGVEQLYDA